MRWARWWALFLAHYTWLGVSGSEAISQRQLAPFRLLLTAANAALSAAARASQAFFKRALGSLEI